MMMIMKLILSMVSNSIVRLLNNDHFIIMSLANAYCNMDGENKSVVIFILSFVGNAQHHANMSV